MTNFQKSTIHVLSSLRILVRYVSIIVDELRLGQVMKMGNERTKCKAGG